MEREEIKIILPHRDDMLLIDDVEIREGKAVGHYRVRGDEFFLRGHFPGHPVVPGVILCEILAQSACILLGDSLEKGSLPVYTGLDKVRFRREVHPGDLIETECEIRKSRHPFYFAAGRVLVEGRVCVTAEFSFAITGE